MKKRSSIFTENNSSSANRGNMLIELMMSVALAAIAMPFIFDFQHRAIRRAENIVVIDHMNDVRGALERYIVAHRPELLRVVGKNISRVDVGDLIEFGLSPDIVDIHGDKYQLRILKSGNGASATLQGVVVMSGDDMSALRTREIVEMGGGELGYVEGTRAYGGFDAWHTNVAQIGLDFRDENAIVETTSVNRDNAMYLARMPSDDMADATMLSALNLGGHDIVNASGISAKNLGLDSVMLSGATVAKNAIFKTRPGIDGAFESENAIVSGILSSDSRTLEVAGKFKLADTAKFSSLTVEDLWVNNLTLSGLSISDTDTVSVLDINNALDMTYGRIDAMYVTVSFAGSITPRLNVRERIEDSRQPEYYWDMSSKTANFVDLTLVELNRMATYATYAEGDANTASGQIFSAVSANKNATVADYMTAINEIQARVRAKYRLLNLE